MNWQFWGFIASGVQLLLTALVLIVGGIVANKIMNNDLKHLSQYFHDLKDEVIKFKDTVDSKLGNLDKTMNRLDKRLLKRETICNERHKK